MTREKLKELLVGLETYRVEKTRTTTDVDKFCEAICAFSNDMPNSKLPGYLIIGVNEDGTACGVKANDKLLKDLAGLRTDGNILPIPAMTVEHFSMEGGDVVVISVQPSLDPPVRYRGRCFIRIGPLKGIATKEEEDILAERRQYTNRSFDMQPCREASLEDIDVEAFTNLYLPRAVDAAVLKDDTRAVTEKMAALRLFDKTCNCPTNAAVLLFGREPKYFFPGAYIQHVQFDGVDNASDIINQNVFSGSLCTMLPRLEAFVETAVIQKRPLPISILREDVSVNYPQWAIRELLMNAVMHRDYRGNTPTKFYQYKDRLEIVNPGGLFGNARPENFPRVNDYRNPVIAEALKVLGFVNKFNRGIARVQRELQVNGNGAAMFGVNDITVFSVNVPEADRVNDIVNRYKDEDFGALSFSDKSLDILSVCAGGWFSQGQLMENIGLSNQTNNIRNHLTPLINQGLIVKADKRTDRVFLFTISEKGLAYLAFCNRNKLLKDYLDV